MGSRTFSVVPTHSGWNHCSHSSQHTNWNVPSSGRMQVQYSTSLPPLGLSCKQRHSRQSPHDICPWVLSESSESTLTPLLLSRADCLPSFFLVVSAGNVGPARLDFASFLLRFSIECRRGAVLSARTGVRP